MSSFSGFIAASFIRTQHFSQDCKRLGNDVNVYCAFFSLSSCNWICEGDLVAVMHRNETERHPIKIVIEVVIV